MSGAVLAALARLPPEERLHWIAFGHYDPTEGGAISQSINQSLAAD
jgi:hypothetical protein